MYHTLNWAEPFTRLSHRIAHLPSVTDIRTNYQDLRAQFQHTAKLFDLAEYSFLARVGLRPACPFCLGWKVRPARQHQSSLNTFREIQPDFQAEIAEATGNEVHP